MPTMSTKPGLEVGFEEEECSFPCWLTLPDHVLLHIFSFFGSSTLAKAGLVCKGWLRVAFDELLWKDLFYCHWGISRSIPMAPGKYSWILEYKRLLYHTPSVESEVLKQHADQVLHVSFSHNGKMFATCSKDGFIRVWDATYPTSIKFKSDMRKFTWKYTQFSQFNSTDTLLLVSGVHFGSLSTSGEIAVFSIEGDFMMQSRVMNKPYDVFGTWYNDLYLLSGNLQWMSHFNSSSVIWLNKAYQETMSEEESVVMRLFKFSNINASSIRTIMIANCLTNEAGAPSVEENSLAEDSSTDEASLLVSLPLIGDLLANQEEELIEEPEEPNVTAEGKGKKMEIKKIVKTNSESLQNIQMFENGEFITKVVEVDVDKPNSKLNCTIEYSKDYRLAEGPKVSMMKGIYMDTSEFSSGWNQSGSQISSSMNGSSDVIDQSWSPLDAEFGIKRSQSDTEDCQAEPTLSVGYNAQPPSPCEKEHIQFVPSDSERALKYTSESQSNEPSQNSIETQSIGHSQSSIETQSIGHSHSSIESRSAEKSQFSVETQSMGHSPVSVETQYMGHSPVSVETQSMRHSPVSVETQSMGHSPVSVETQSMGHSPVSVETQSMGHSPVSVETQSMGHSPVSVETQSMGHSPVSVETQSMGHSPVSVEAQSMEHSPVSVETQSMGHSPVSVETQSMGHSPVSVETQSMGHSPVSVETQSMGHSSVSGEVQEGEVDSSNDTRTTYAVEVSGMLAEISSQSVPYTSSPKRILHGQQPQHGEVVRDPSTSEKEIKFDPQICSTTPISSVDTDSPELPEKTPRLAFCCVDYKKQKKIVPLKQTLTRNEPHCKHLKSRTCLGTQSKETVEDQSVSEVKIRPDCVSGRHEKSCKNVQSRMCLGRQSIETVEGEVNVDAGHGRAQSNLCTGMEKQYGSDVGIDCVPGRVQSRICAGIGTTSVQHNEYQFGEDDNKVKCNPVRNTCTMQSETSSVKLSSRDSQLNMYKAESDVPKFQYNSPKSKKGKSRQIKDKYLIFTKGSETHTPHQIGIKRIKPFQAFSEDGSRLLPNVSDNTHMLERGEDVNDDVDHLIDMHGHIIGMTLSPDQRFLYVNSRPWPKNYHIENPLYPPPIAQEIDIHVIDLLNMREVGTMHRAHKAYTSNDECFFIFLDVCEEYVASGAEDKHGYLWDRHYGLCLHKYPHTDVVNSVAFNPADSEVLVTVSDDFSIKIWRSLNREKEVTL